MYLKLHISERGGGAKVYMCTKLIHIHIAVLDIMVTTMRMHAFCRKMADYTYGLQQSECLISATEQFQREPHKCFDLG